MNKLSTWQWVAAALAGMCFATAARASQFTDLWWNPRESGWGASIVQQDDVAFVMLFVYERDGSPRWYVAPDAKVFAYDAQGLPLFRGALYRTEGPWHGGAFDAANVRTSRAGDLYLEPLGRDVLRLSYTADGVAVAREVQRMTWGRAPLGGFYQGAFNLRYAVPGRAPYGARRFGAEISIDAEGDAVAMTIAESAADVCELRGRQTQSGKYAEVSGTYACSDGESGWFAASELETSSHALSGRLRLVSPAVERSGRFSAVR